jgi:hypothetical protein
MSHSIRRTSTLGAVLFLGLILQTTCRAADHNDPNSVNSIFLDIALSAADLYDMFGFPADGPGPERVVLALTFAAVPKAGVFDTDMLYRVRIYGSPRAVWPTGGEEKLDSMLKYATAEHEKFVHAPAAEVRVKADKTGHARIDFIGFPGGTFSKTVQIDQVTTFNSTDGQPIKVFLGGRDDAFFNDLPGFFRSINYAPQFYHVPHTMTNTRELPIPKTLIELEGNSLFNHDDANPNLGQVVNGQVVKEDLPQGPLTWKGNRFHKDANGNYRFVYSGRDAQAGKNVNAIILELPLSFISAAPATHRIVNAWGESWVLKAAHKIETADDSGCCFNGAWAWITSWFSNPTSFDKELENYKRIDTDGVPFADAALNERLDDRQIGADNETLATHFVTRLGHLGWGFGPSITALGLGTCFDVGNAPVSLYKTYALAAEAFPFVKKCLFQEVNMPDDSWNKHHRDIPLKRTFEIFIPNVCAVDMDTNGSWPYGRRLEDQVANRFLSIFLDMRTGCAGGKCNVETLSSQALWDAAPVEPKTSPNPLHNDVPFLDHFPYLADPHTTSAY